MNIKNEYPIVNTIKSSEINQIDGYFKWIQDKELPVKSDEEAHKKLALEVIDGWESVDISWLKLINFTAQGGSYTFNIFIDIQSVPEEKKAIVKAIELKSIVLHSRVLLDTDPFIDEKMRVAHRLLYKYDLILPRLYEGKDWWIERCVENNKTLLSIEEYAVLMAKFHCLPTDWHNTFHEKYINEWPELKEAHPHGHIWNFVANANFCYVKNRKFKTFINHEKHYEPQTEVGKRIVNVHSDFYDSNVLYDEDIKKAYIIDLENLSIGWAARDLAFIFWWIDNVGEMGLFKDIRPNENMTNHEAKFLFVETYQKQLNFSHEKSDIEDLIFDAECAKLRHFHCVLYDDMKFKRDFDENYEFDLYKEHERIEILAKNDENLKKEVIEKGIYKVVNEQSIVISKIREMIAQKKENSKPDKIKTSKINQNDSYFKWIQDKELPVKSDEEAHKKLALEVIDCWESIDISWLKLINFTAQGGSYTYNIFIDIQSVPEEKKAIVKAIKLKSIVLHSRVLLDTNPFIEEKMRVAHRLLYKHDLILPRLYEGKDWWIERCVENNKTLLSIEEYAVLMAKLHSLPTDWHNTFHEKYINEWPELKEAHPHGHIWTNVANANYWYLKIGKFKTFINHEKHYEPQTEAGKRIVNVHSDFYHSNVLYDENIKKAYVIDLEYLSVGWAARDLAFIFFWIDLVGKSHIFKDIRPNENMTTYEAKFLFIETYQKQLNFSHEKSDIEDLIFDAECAKLRHFHCVLYEDAKFKRDFDENYEFDLYKEYERIEILAKNDDNLKKEVIEKGIIKVVNEQSILISKIREMIVETKEKDTLAKNIVKTKKELS